MNEFLRTAARSFLLCSLFIAIDMGIIGLALTPEAKLGYEVLFVPPIYAFLCTLPSFFMYSKKELSPKRAVVGRVLQIITIEAIVLGAIKLHQPEMSLEHGLIIGASILVVFAAVWLVNFLRARSDAKALNEKLKKMNG